MHPAFEEDPTLFAGDQFHASAEGHLLFAASMTAYIVLAIRFEERDLVVEHGRKYREYRQRLPMLVPFWRGVRPRDEDGQPTSS